jgi:hypothetical protein
MAIDRRALLGAAFGVAMTGRARASGDQLPQGPMFAAACRTADGGWSAALLTERGLIIRLLALPGRGHDASFCPVTRRCVVFARRPGTFALVFTADRSRAPVLIEAAEGRHFYGHGVFSADGRLLYATENDWEAARGVIGVYDAGADFARVGELPSHGLGPHDVALLAHEPVLVVANGGYREHPDFGHGRRILNAETVETSLCYIDARTGDLLEQHTVGQNSRLSLRHISVSPDGTIGIGAQVEGGRAAGTPLLFRHRRQAPIETLPLEESHMAALANYVSSVAIDRSGRTLAATSSRGGVVIIVDIASGAVVALHTIADVSGVAHDPDRTRFATTAGTGRVCELSMTTPITVRDLSNAAVAWDNHLAGERDGQ